MKLSTTCLALMFLALTALPLASSAADGEYLARAGDCVACHSAPGGAFMAGGVPFDTPIGRIYSSNISPDAEHGIGAYSFDEFDRAMRQGVRKDGQALYPAMPFTSYAKLSGEDMRALYDYFMQQVPAQAVANQPVDIPWPLSMRWPLKIWQSLFHDAKPFAAQPNQSAAYNRGAYLVQGLGHCGACHTPRGWAMQELASDERGTQFLAGSELDGWYASNLRQANFSRDDIINLLRTGRSQNLAVSGPMGDVISHSSQYLNQADLHGIAEYLLAIADQPAQTATAVVQPVSAPVSAAGTYASYCAVCHGRKGEGSEFVVPALAGNPTVLAADSSSLLQVLLNGSHSPRTEVHMGYAMPGYGWTLDDQQMADLANYLRGSWGNQAEAVTSAQVAGLRGQQRAH